MKLNRERDTGRFVQRLRMILLPGIFLLSAGIQNSFAAGYMFVYSDSNTCPEGTTPLNTWVNFDQKIEPVIESWDEGNHSNGMQETQVQCKTTLFPNLNLKCYAEAAGQNKTCYRLVAVANSGDGDSGNDTDFTGYCIYDKVTYDSFRVCKWDLP